MTFGFPAHFTESRTFPHQPDELTLIVKSALEDLGWRYEALGDMEFRASISISLSSWGERLRVEIFPGSVIQVESKCAYPLQCLDWGKNKENVQAFFARVAQMEGRGILLAASEDAAPAFDERGRSPVERVFSKDADG